MKRRLKLHSILNYHPYIPRPTLFDSTQSQPNPSLQKPPISSTQPSTLPHNHNRFPSSTSFPLPQPPLASPSPSHSPHSHPSSALQRGMPSPPQQTESQPRERRSPRPSYTCLVVGTRGRVQRVRCRWRSRGGAARETLLRVVLVSVLLSASVFWDRMIFEVVGDFGLCDYYDEGWSLMCLLYEKGAGEWLGNG